MTELKAIVPVLWGLAAGFLWGLAISSTGAIMLGLIVGGIIAAGAAVRLAVQR